MKETLNSATPPTTERRLTTAKTCNKRSPWLRCTQTYFILKMCPEMHRGEMGVKDAMHVSIHDLARAYSLKKKKSIFFPTENHKIVSHDVLAKCSNFHLLGSALLNWLLALKTQNRCSASLQNQPEKSGLSPQGKPVRTRWDHPGLCSCGTWTMGEAHLWKKGRVKHTNTFLCALKETKSTEVQN